MVRAGDVRRLAATELTVADFAWIFCAVFGAATVPTARYEPATIGLPLALAAILAAPALRPLVTPLFLGLFGAFVAVRSTPWRVSAPWEWALLLVALASLGGAVALDRGVGRGLRRALESPRVQGGMGTAAGFVFGGLWLLSAASHLARLDPPAIAPFLTVALLLLASPWGRALGWLRFAPAVALVLTGFLLLILDPLSEVAAHRWGAGQGLLLGGGALSYGLTSLRKAR